MNKLRCYDNSRLADFKTCPRSYFFRHLLGWRREGNALPLTFGLSWHSGLEFLWSNAKKLPSEQLLQGSMLSFLETWSSEGLSTELSMDEEEFFAPRTPGVAHEMYYNYLNARKGILQNCTVIGNEQPFAVPMPSLEKTWYIGKMDKVIELNGERLVIEHKTTTAYSIKHGFQPDYVESWGTSSQVKGYEFGANLHYEGIDGVWVDAALVHKKIHDQFKIIPISHNVTLLQEWIANTATWIRVVQENEATFASTGNLTEKQCFQKNEESCFGKYGKCPYLDICRTIADPTTLKEPPPGYILDRWEPFDELGLSSILNEETENG